MTYFPLQAHQWLIPFVHCDENIGLELAGFQLHPPFPPWLVTGTNQSHVYKSAPVKFTRMLRCLVVYVTCTADSNRLLSQRHTAKATSPPPHAAHPLLWKQNHAWKNPKRELWFLVKVNTAAQGEKSEDKAGVWNYYSFSVQKALSSSPTWSTFLFWHLFEWSENVLLSLGKLFKS